MYKKLLCRFTPFFCTLDITNLTICPYIGIEVSRENNTFGSADSSPLKVKLLLNIKILPLQSRAQVLVPSHSEPSV